MKISGSDIRRLMRRHGKTIAGLSQQMQITKKRVRQVRADGVSGSAFVMDWLEALTGSPWPSGQCRTASADVGTCGACRDEGEQSAVMTR